MSATSWSSQERIRWASVALAFVLTACATGGPSATPEPDTEPRDVPADRDTVPEEDAPLEDAEVEDIEDESDAIEEVDEVEDAPDVAEEVEDEPDVAPDVDETDARENCQDEWVGVCRPLQRDCGPNRDEIMRCGFCGEYLSQFRACGPRELCDYDAQGEARCRPCATGDDCPDPNIQCEPGQRGCRAWNEPYECASNGVIRSLGACPSGTACTDGACAFEGRPRGSGCAGNRDCQGGGCVCGEEYRVRVPEEAACFLDVADGYCTRLPCDLNPCQPGQEFCADFGEIGRFGGDRFCVGIEGCSQRGAACNDNRWTCRDLPSRAQPQDQLRWELGCWPAALSSHGESCDVLTGDCVGGNCLRSASSSATYCSSPCGEGATCPSNAACVEFPANSGQHQCLVRSDAAPCTNRLANEIGIAVRTLRVFNSASTASVCIFPNLAN